MFYHNKKNVINNNTNNKKAAKMILLLKITLNLKATEEQKEVGAAPSATNLPFMFIFKDLTVIYKLIHSFFFFFIKCASQ